MKAILQYGESKIHANHKFTGLFMIDGMIVLYSMVKLNVLYYN